MSESKIHSALVSAYLASAVMPQARTVFEGRSFEPVTGQSWARLTMLPADRSPAAQGVHAPDEWVGRLQIDLFHPLNAGHAPVLADAEKAIVFFRPGKRLAYEGQGVLIRGSQRSQIRKDGIWLMVSVDVRLTAWIFPD